MGKLLQRQGLWSKPPQNTEEKKTLGKDALVWRVFVPPLRHSPPSAALLLFYSAMTVLSVQLKASGDPHFRVILWQEWNRDLLKQCPISRLVYLIICVRMFPLNVCLCTSALAAPCGCWEPNQGFCKARLLTAELLLQPQMSYCIKKKIVIARAKLHHTQELCFSETEVSLTAIFF